MSEPQPYDAQDQQMYAESGAKLGTARHALLLEVARLNFAMMIRPDHIPEQEWVQITNAADDLVQADTEYRTAISPDTQPYPHPEGEPAPVFTAAEVMKIMEEWEEAARFNLEEARKNPDKPELYYLGSVDTLAHVRDDFERRARHAW
jgi:hypothetical protein